MITGAIARFAAAMGVLRLLLAAVIVVLAITAPFADDGPIVYEGFTLWPRLIAPALAPMVFFVLLLDIMMTLIFRADAEGAQRRRLGLVLGVEVVLVALLVGSWLPFFRALL